MILLVSLNILIGNKVYIIVIILFDFENVFPPANCSTQLLLSFSLLKLGSLGLSPPFPELNRNWRQGSSVGLAPYFQQTNKHWGSRVMSKKTYQIWGILETENLKIQFFWDLKIWRQHFIVIFLHDSVMESLLWRCWMHYLIIMFSKNLFLQMRRQVWIPLYQSLLLITAKNLIIDQI